ncbi:RnfABCDGE type electron transport complex subunit B [Acinetobacter rudis]|uniref:RnfABCDGE type electron transport complex subunit B n=1 Tax=Acinetobacter rudis TaxID=632955 RepID=UPI00280DBE6A|nr:RnfABCDGE type electron transport complex subunit B [Acinetobacter rudis]MDQ8951609.1 RnfABCDGE type electron transport complex subunit B [Acinetobacter rudis]
MNLNITLTQQIDAVLPQTQCGLCGHRDGCLPYAQAIVDGEEANKCIPGGQPVADQLAQLLNRPKLTAEQSVWPIQSDGRPQRMKAVIREDECIGCTKCISACPVDAIIGSGKLMHSILTDLCTGCELCIPPCPVDCIDLVEDQSPLITEQQRTIEQDELRSRYYAHIQRQESRRNTHKGPTVRAAIESEVFSQFTTEIGIDHDQVVTPPQTAPEQDAKRVIELAKIRTQMKKLDKQLTVRPDPAKQQLLAQLKEKLAMIEGA